MRIGLKWLSAITCAGMFFVLLGGALVTKTNSGKGCGDDWPLCNGRFVPAYTIESLIEYSHRAVTGIVGLLVLLTAIAVWVKLRHRKEALLYAFSALFFTGLQAMLGAMAVKWGQSSAVMALHFGFSLLAFSSTLLLAILMWRNGESDRAAGVHSNEAAQVRVRVTKSFAYWVWGTAIYSYIVVYIGAFVRHTKSSGGCTGWPLCNGEIVPELSGATSIAFGHRAAALLFLLMVLRLAYLSQIEYKSVSGIRNAGLAALFLAFMQAGSGALVVFSIGSGAYVFSSLLHTVIMAGLFGVLCYLSILVWQLAQSRPSGIDRPGPATNSNTVKGREHNGTR